MLVVVLFSCFCGCVVAFLWWCLCVCVFGFFVVV